jgi:hypothetical protein
MISILGLHADATLRESAMWIALLTVTIFAASMLALLFCLNHFTRSLSLPVEQLDRKPRNVLTTAQATHFDTR